MVVIVGRAGGLGNRLFVFAHFIANAIELNYQIANPSFFDFAKYFKTTSNNLFCSYPIKTSTFQNINFLQNIVCYQVCAALKIFSKKRVFGTFVSLLDITSSDKYSESYDLFGEEFSHIRNITRYTFVRGWLFRDYGNMRKYADTIREFFIPVDFHAINVNNLIEKARKGCDILIGVHIRQGDYRTFANGKYFYQTFQYYQFMRQASELFPNQKVKFLICSNVNQNLTVFKDLDYVLGSNHILEDMYAFAKCDYLIGPPSTYTGWASFYGSVPIFTIITSEEKLSLNNLRVCDG